MCCTDGIERGEMQGFTSCDGTCLFSVKFCRQQPVTREGVEGPTQMLWPWAKLGCFIDAVPSF